MTVISIDEFDILEKFQILNKNVLLSLFIYDVII
jgi:hypothetical protein